MQRDRTDAGSGPDPQPVRTRSSVGRVVIGCGRVKSLSGIY